MINRFLFVSDILIDDINIDSIAIRNDHLQLRDTLNNHNIYRVELPPTKITPTPIDCVCTNLLTDELHVEI